MQRRAAAILALATAALAHGCAGAPPAAGGDDTSVRFVSWNVRQWRELSADECRETAELLKSARPVRQALGDDIECMLLPDVSYVLEVTSRGETHRVGVVGSAPFIHASTSDEPDTFQEVDPAAHRRVISILQQRSAH